MDICAGRRLRHRRACPSARSAAGGAVDPAYACAMADRLNTRQVVTETATATTNPAQYGAVIPNVDATVPASSAPAQLPPAAMNIVVLPTRPRIAGGVSLCVSELATIVHSEPCTPNTTSSTPTRKRLCEVASVRCSAASTRSPTLSVQVADTQAINRSPMTDPSMPPAATHANSTP